MSDGVVLIICLIIIVIFVGIVVYWLIRNSKPCTINDTVKGLCDYAQLGQLCATNATGTAIGENSTFLPGYFQPQNCDKGLACIPIKNNSEYGYCKSKLDNYCTNVYDCAPPSYAGGTGTTIFCSGGICSQIPLGVLFSSCSGASNSIGLQCDTVDLNLICSNGTCLGNIGFGCTSQNECASGLFCDTTANQCIPPILPTGTCNGDYCTSGFGCTGGVCEPLFSIAGTKQFFAPQPGEVGAFCTPGTSAVSPYSCNNNLICNIDTFLNAPTSSPGVTGIFSGVTGFGLCSNPILPAGNSCSSIGNACIPPLVCYNGVCQAPEIGGIQDINYCGVNSTGICDLTGIYTCVNDRCQPNISGLCNGSTGFCNTGNCTGDKLGIFTLDRSGITGTPNIGLWQYLDLPVGETGPSNQSTLSTFQNMVIDVNGNPITKTKCIYYPYYMTTDPYFWLAEFESGTTGAFTVSSNWTKYDINNTGNIYLIDGVKFTQGGNLTIKYSLASDANHLSKAIIYNGYTTGDVDFSTPTLGPIDFALIFVPIRVLDWDVDDVYNQGIIGLTSDTGGVGRVSYGALPTMPGPYSVTGVWPSHNNITNATWCKYYISDSGPNITSFMVGIDNTIQGPNISPNIILAESQSTGAAFFSTYSNYFSKFELYYASDRSFRYVNSVSTSTSQNTEDLPIEGYTPDFAQSTEPCPLPTPLININYISTMSMGNIDARFFSLVTICQ